MNENKNKFPNSLVDGDGHEISLTNKDFDFVQKDKNIHDVAFKSKPTTFLKDALRRFVKSKPAMVGFSIVGLILIMAIVVPFCTENKGVFNVGTDGGGNTVEYNLNPKLFNAGTGFWDGTVRRTRMVYDNASQAPVGYAEGTYSKVSTYEEVENGVVNKYASGGYVNIFCSNLDSNANFYSPLIDFDFTNDYNLKINLIKEDYLVYKFNGVRISLFDDTNHYYLVGDENSYSNELNYDINVKETLASKGYDTSLIKSARIYFDVPYDENGSTSSILIKDVNIFSNKEEEKEKLAGISFKDATDVMTRESSNEFAWNGNFGKTTYKVHVTYCDFTYDPYEAAYGKRDATYGALEIQAFEIQDQIKTNFSKDNAYATSDKDVLASRFTILSDKLPFVEITEQVGDATYNSASKKWSGYQLKVKVLNYKVLGYSSMPRFIFGTNNVGKDYFKLIFTGLRFSLVLAIGVSLVNIIIGLIWGSISGYFGGWTDIVMERICDIISGLPSTVIITLCILYGREFNWGSSADVIALMVALFMTGWMGVSARTRTQFYRYKGREYVLASRTLGAKDGRLIFRHILPNSAGTIITSSVLMIPSVVYTEASIAYLGLGLQNQVMFGVILSEANSYYSGERMYLLLIPTIIMMFLLISFNLFGNGLRDAFNPQLKGGEK